MGVQKGIKTRKSYDADCKQEVTRMLASGRSAKEISETFDVNPWTSFIDFDNGFNFLFNRLNHVSYICLLAHEK
ncbi:hypothetical protein LXM25_00010 [Dyadobacter sp. LJ53]|nr:hypothetical protein [Dyadobacter chenwenxiniae]